MSSGRRVRIVLVVIAAISMLFAVVLAMSTDARDKVSSVDTDTFSKSALGHHALVSWLRQARQDVLVSRWRSQDRLSSDNLLVLLEPHLAQDKDGKVRDELEALLAGAKTTLLVLPRRDGVQAADGEWISHVTEVKEADHRELLPMLDLGSGLVTLPEALAPGAWRVYDDALNGMPPTLESPQLLKGSGLSPIIETDAGVLLGKVRNTRSGGALYVLTDPDLIANHGLHRGQNAALVLAIFKLINAQDGVIVIDEVIHGYRQPPSLGRMLLTFPLVLATIQVFLILLVVLWASVGRFGPARRSSLKAAFHEQFYVQNTAELLEHGGHSAYMLERYVWMVIEQIGRQLNAPPELDRPELLLWVHRASEARQLQFIHLPTVISRVERWSTGKSKPRAQQLVTVATQISRLRGALLDGTVTATTAQSTATPRA